MTGPAAGRGWPGWLAASAVTMILPSLVSWAAGGQDWFDTLRTPAPTPPDWAFGVVWPVLYLAMGTAAWLVWRRRGASGAAEALWLYGAQYALNLAWIVGFFGLRSVVLGWVLIPPLGAAVVVTLLAFARVSPLAAALLAPYLAWVCFAGWLAWKLVRLNG